MCCLLLQVWSSLLIMRSSSPFPYSSTEKRNNLSFSSSICAVRGLMPLVTCKYKGFEEYVHDFSAIDLVSVHAVVTRLGVAVFK